MIKSPILSSLDTGRAPGAESLSPRRALLGSQGASGPCASFAEGQEAPLSAHCPPAKRWEISKCQQRLNQLSD